MKIFVLACVVVVVSCSLEPYNYQPPQARGSAALTRTSAEASAFDNVNKGDGSYRFSYESAESSVHESGSPRASGPEGPAVTAEGGFSYRAPDGQLISLTYVADENGFHPVGSHIPTPPPIPEEILRSLRLIGQGGHQSNEGAYHLNAPEAEVIDA